MHNYQPHKAKVYLHYGLAFWQICRSILISLHINECFQRRLIKDLIDFMGKWLLVGIFSNQLLNLLLRWANGASKFDFENNSITVW